MRMIDKTARIGRNWFAHYSNDSTYHQAEAAGLSLRIGHHLLVFGRIDYREKACPWPMRYRVALGFARPVVGS